MDFKTLKNEKEIKMYLNAALSNKNWTSAYHYTSLESLYQIFKSKTLRLSNIKGMNDILESNFANDIDECFFCMSRGSGGKIENFGMWAMYGHIRDYDAKDPKKIGVKIEFTKEVLENLIKENSGSNLRLVAYTDLIWEKNKTINFSSSTQNKNVKRFSSELHGYLKDNSWSYEKELRICVKTTEQSAEHTFINVPDYLLEKLIVFPSPLANISHCQDEYNKLVQGNAAIVPTFRENSYKQLFQTNNERREKL